MHRVIGFKFLFVAAALVFTNFGAAAQTQTPLPKAKGTAPGAAGTVQAQPSTGPDMTTESYGDWILRCSKTNDARRCEVSQTLIMQGQNAPIALIAFGRDKKGEPLRMVIQLPNNITLESGVKTLTANGETAIELKFRRCLAVGCFADAVLTDPLIGKLRSQTEPLSIRFKDGNERDISLPFSPKGLGPALDALARAS